MAIQSGILEEAVSKAAAGYNDFLQSTCHLPPTREDGLE